MTLRRYLLLVMLLCFATAATAEAPRGSITIDRIADIKYPTNPAWSPDGKMVAFLWDAAGIQNLFVVTPGQNPVALTDFPGDPNMLVSDISRFAWASPNQILFEKDGQLWTVSPSSPKPARVSGLDDAENFAESDDKKQIAFTRKNQIWVGSLNGSAPIPLGQNTKAQRLLTSLPESLTASALVFSPDNKYVAFLASHPFVDREEMRYNGDWIRSFHRAASDRRLGVVPVHGGDTLWIPTLAVNISEVQWTGDGSVLFQELSSDRKTRFIKVWSVGGGIPRILWKDYDAAWWSPTARDSRTVVSPDGKSVAFVSDRTGWIHLYVMPVNATSEEQARQLTSGNYGAGFGSWSPDSKRIAYHHSVDGNQMERFIDILDVATKKTEPVVTARGVNFDPFFSPDSANLVYSRSAVEHSLELYTVPARAESKVVRLTDSMPPGLLASDLTAPVAVKFPSRVDGKPVPATLMVPKNLDRTRKHPAIVWIHGSGPDQNYLGWHPGSYRMYYSAAQYLAQQGYVILTPDYRHSSGYSRDWATGSYMDEGGGEYLDIASGADYLKTLGYVDPDRIGVWGLSYGGYLTLQAVTVTPTLFRCAIDVAGVSDWDTYSTFSIGGTPIPQMGTPAENPEGYYRSAVVKHLDKLVRPLLILHGTNDTNVSFSESLTVFDTLVKLGKSFEMAVYPGEVHFFRRAHVLRDAWRRAEDFFDRNLKNGAMMTSNQ